MFFVELCVNRQRLRGPTIENPCHGSLPLREGGVLPFLQTFHKSPIGRRTTSEETPLMSKIGNMCDILSEPRFRGSQQTRAPV